MTYYVYFASHAPLSTKSMGYHHVHGVYDNELDATGLFFEENMNKTTGKRYSFSKHVSLRYQTRTTSNFLAIGALNEHNGYEQKIAQLIFDYVQTAVRNSPVVVLYLSLDGEENKPFTNTRTAHASTITKPADLVLDERHCLRLYRNKQALEFLDDKWGHVYVANPQYVGDQGGWK